MILNTFQLPKILADVVTTKRPKAFSQGEKRLKHYLVTMYKVSDLYDGMYTLDSEDANIYVHTAELSSSLSSYPIGFISNLVGVEPKLDNPKSMDNLNPSPIIRMASGDAKFDRLVIMGNSLLRAHFDLANLKTFDQIVETLDSGETGPVFDKSATVINVIRNLSTLYRDLLEETHEMGFLNTLSSRLFDPRPGLDLTTTPDYFYITNSTYVVDAMAVATMKLLYHNICGDAMEMSKLATSSMDTAINSLIALTVIDNSFEDVNSVRLMESKEIVSRIVDTLCSDGVGTKSYLNVVAEIACAIGSVERSIK